MPDNVYDLVQDKLDSFDMARQECRIVYPLIGQIFEFEASSRTLLYSHPGFKERVQDWLGGSASLMDEFVHQKIVTVYNIWTRTTTSFNSLRSQKPKKAQKLADEEKMLKESMKGTRCINIFNANW